MTPEREKQIRKIRSYTSVKEEVPLKVRNELLVVIDELREENRLLKSISDQDNETIKELRHRLKMFREVLKFYATNDIHSADFDWQDNGSFARTVLILDNEMEK